eukprot:COSAG05_NODE_1183_length_5592_cov_2.043328_2_plen_144_part_00
MHDSGGGGVVCYVKNDSPKPFKGTVDVSAVTFASGKSSSLKKLTLDMPAGAGTTQWFSLPGAVDGTSEILIATVTDSAGTVRARPLVSPPALPESSVYVQPRWFSAEFCLILTFSHSLVLAFSHSLIRLLARSLALIVAGVHR